jgi:hypothetical protein
VRHAPVFALWPEFRAYLTFQSPEIVISTVRNLDELYSIKAISSDSLSILFPFIINHPCIEYFGEIAVLRLVSRYGTQNSLKDIFDKIIEINSSFCQQLIKISASKTIHFFVQSLELSSLFRFSDALAYLGLISEAITGYQELVVKSSDPILQDQARENRDKLQSTWLLPGLPDWYKWDQCDKGLYYELAIEPDYSCRYFEDTINHHRGTLEIISVDRILSYDDFPSINAWFEYLESLNNNGVINLIGKGELPDQSSPKVFVIYEFPDGYLTFTEWSSRRNFHIDENLAIEVSIETAGVMEKSKTGLGFAFYNASPCNVLWNQAGNIRLANIGSSLVIPKYVCGINNCNKSSIQSEIGHTTGGYFLGLLTLQILLGFSCPIQLVDKAKSNGISPLVSNLDELALTPHFQNVLMRMLHKQPDFRYPTFKPLIDDLKKIQNFISEYEIFNKRVPEQNREKGSRIFILLNFVSFRLGVICRNPRLSKLAPINKVEQIINQLSSDLNYYSSSDLKYWQTRISWNGYKRSLPDFKTWRWLSPETRSILGIAFGWLELLSFVEENGGVKISDQLIPLLIAHVIHIESIAVVQGILKFNQLQPNIVEKCIDSINMILNIPEDVYKSVNIRLYGDDLSDPITNPYTREQVQEVKEIINYSYQKEWSRFRLESSSLSSLLATVTLLCFRSEFVNDKSEVIYQNEDILKLYKPIYPDHDLLVIIKFPSNFEAFLNSFINSDKQFSVSDDELYKQTRTILQFLRRINPCHRIPGRLLSYQAISSPREGEIQFQMMPFKKEKRVFSEKNVFTNGDLFIASNSERVIQVDIFKSKNGAKVSSIFSASVLFPNLQNDFSKLGLLSKVARWMRTKRLWIIRLIIIGPTIGLFLIDYLSGKPSSINLFDMIKKFIPWAVGMIIGNALWDLIKYQIPLFNPEDSKMFEAVKINKN